jgi:hypothetical protein
MSQCDIGPAPKAGTDVAATDLSADELAHLDLCDPGIFLLPTLCPPNLTASTPFSLSSVADEEFPQTPEPDPGIGLSGTGIGLGIDHWAMLLSTSFSDGASEGYPADFKVQQNHQCSFCGREFQLSGMLT